MRKLALLLLAAAGVTLLALFVGRLSPSSSTASSHREAPLISEDPTADNTDLYAFRSPDKPNTLTVISSQITGNTGGYWTQVKQGTVTNLGTAFGVNALSATVSNSTLQGR